jgi:tetratricopeptide (TPR) repeat protein
MALAVITLAVYMQVGNHQFLNYDDKDYVTSNRHVADGISVDAVLWAFTSVKAGNWHPVTWLSHMADVQFYGMNPRGHHLSNVVIHTASSLLLLFLLLRLSGSLWKSTFVAALFALHPLHVESVAWVAERKDVLSAFFGFLTILIYSEYVAKRTAVLYILTLLTFVFALMSKAMLVTLPAIMLLMDLLLFDRCHHENHEQNTDRIITLVKEKIPFFACSIISSIITVYAQHMSGATKSLDEFAILLRIENALVAYVKYMLKVLWPQDLAVLYPISHSIPLWQVIGSLLILLLFSVTAIRAGRNHPFFSLGWFWFIVTLVPVIGIIQVGNQSMADRYTYIPVIGLFIMIAWGVPVLVKGLQFRKEILTILFCAVIISSAALTWQQLGYWRSTISLFQHTLKITTDNYMANNFLGIALAENGDLDAAIKEFQISLRIKPNYVDAHDNLGVALGRTGNLNEAILEFLEALRINPDYVNAQNNLKFTIAQKRANSANYVESK